MKILQRGAEAILYREKNILIKERIKKSYRHPEIDIYRRKYATRREASLLQKASQLISVPKLLKVDEKEMKLELEYVEGFILRDILEKEDLEKLCNQIGMQIALLHDANIIHGDLTTSNMILKDDKIYFIDFGLGFISEKIEDKAVDLHLLRQALEAKHYRIAEKTFKNIIEGYKKNTKYLEVLARLKKVEKRGRYKEKDH